MKPTTEYAKEWYNKHTEKQAARIRMSELELDYMALFAEHCVNELLNPKQIDKIRREVIINEYKESLKESPEEKENNFNNIKDDILNEYQKGNIVIADVDGLKTAPIKEFIKQPVEGILYDLNRNESVVLTFINDPKWINDYAVAKVIRELKKLINQLK